MPSEQKKTKLSKLDKILNQVKFEDDINDLILTEIETIGDNVNKVLMSGDIDIAKKNDGHVQASKEIKKFKVQTKKFEFEQQLKHMLKDNVISKIVFDGKMDLIKKNVNWIEEAVDDDKKMKELQFKLGIVNEVLPEVMLMSDQSKANPLQEQKQKEREAKIYIKKLNADRKIRDALKKQRDDELKKKEEQAKEKRVKELLEEQIKTEFEQKKRKKEIYSKIAARATSRKKIDEETTLKYEEVKAREPMYKKIESKYQKSVEMPALEKKKEQLEKIRNFYKPIDKQDFETHVLKHEAKKMELDLEKQKIRQEEIYKIKAHAENIHYKPNNDPQHIEQIGIMDKKKGIEQRRKLNEEQKEKIDNYGKYVREMYWPKVSVKKQLELEQIKSTLKTSPLRKSVTKEVDSDEDDIKIPGKQYLNYDRPWQLAMSKKKKDEGMNRKDSYVSLQNKNGFAKSTQPYSDIDMDKATKKSSPQFTIGAKSVRQTLHKKRQNSLIGSRQNSLGGELRRINQSEITGPYAHSDVNSIGNQPNTPHNKKTDYLAEVRKKREEQLLRQKALEASSGKKAPRYMNNNEKVINSYLTDKNLNEYEKLEAVKRKAHAMEERARMQEKLIKVSYKGIVNQEDQYTANVEQTIAVNDMYIDAIQAKLKILDAI